jgi:hypothetical protein
VVGLQGGLQQLPAHLHAYQDSLQKLFKCTNLLNMQRLAMLAESNMLYFGASLRLLLSDD